MIENPKLYFTKPPLIEFHNSKDKVLENTVVIIPHLPKNFSWNDYRVEIFPIGDVTIFPVFSIDGSHIEEDLGGAFFGGYLGLYTPQRSEGDQILIEIEDGLKTTKPRNWRILARFEDGEWKGSNFRLPITIQPEE